MDFLLDLIRLEVVKTQIDVEIMEFFPEQQHQQVLITMIMEMIYIMSRP